MVPGRTSTRGQAIVPPDRDRYLAEIAVDGSHLSRRHRRRGRPPLAGGSNSTTWPSFSSTDGRSQAATEVEELAAAAAERGELSAASRELLDAWPARVAEYRDAQLARVSLSGTPVPRVAVPRYTDDGELLRWLRAENLPGEFPYTAGVFPFKREGEDPARMFAGEGDPFRTNRRFHLLAADQPATRLSTAFDSVTLYGFDPDVRPDVYGKVGNSGVSIATLEDMKELYAGFDLCDPSTSVSMTINGPAPTILAMFLNTAIDDQLHRADSQERGGADPRRGRRDPGPHPAPGPRDGAGRHPQRGPGPEHVHLLHRVLLAGNGRYAGVVHRKPGAQLLLGVHLRLSHRRSGRQPHQPAGLHARQRVHLCGGLPGPGHGYRRLSRRTSPSSSPTAWIPSTRVIGRVARRIWAVAMRDRYRANPRSQKLKYHVQTSGRSLHAQEMAFNDIRTTLQALCAIYDNANSLHTNAYDEAVTTPTTESVRRALAIQMIINHEWGLALNENPLQGSFAIEELTDLVEEAVLTELERLSERGGVLGAMETGYQRGRIQDESMLYETKKHDGSLPIIGVNTFRNPAGDAVPAHLELARSTDDEKQSQLRRLAGFRTSHAGDRPAVLARLQEAALGGDNVFAVLMDAVRSCSLGEITDALFEVGGRYRRNV